MSTRDFEQTPWRNHDDIAREAGRESVEALPKGILSACIVFFAGMLVGGCGTFVININLLGNQTRMAETQTQGTNAVAIKQVVEGGGSANSNVLTATVPMGGL